MLLVCAAMGGASLYGFANGPLPGHAGAPADGGRTCTACHNTFAPANSDARGWLRLEALPYRPGVKQMIRVILEHPEAQRWGFQLTARLASDGTRKAGTFTQGSGIRVACGGTQPAGNCGTETEFAEHTAPTTFAGTRGGVVWEVEWTPPAEGAGEVVFYASGNAANGNFNFQGDRIYTASLRLKAAAECNLTGAPRVTSVRNGASFLEGSFALNTMISIAGSGFQPAGVSIAASEADIYEGRLTPQLACVAVEIAGERAYVTYADAGQINAQIPTVTALGSVPLRVILNPGTANERRSEPFAITLADYAPGLFRFLPSPAVAAVFASAGGLAGDPAAVPGAAKPRIGDVISIYATGLGVSEPVYQAGVLLGRAVAPRARDEVTVIFNGRVMDAADVLYVGLTPGSITGLWQINLRVPAFAAPGADNSVAVRVGGVSSPAGVFLPVGL
jgi:uncharacterized protein (TIGR03437 family)